MGTPSRRAGHVPLPDSGTSRPSRPPCPAASPRHQLDWPWKEAFFACWHRLSARRTATDQ
jgi:hypothetical protein